MNASFPRTDAAPSEALAKNGIVLGGKASVETAYLSAFDGLRTSIETVAGKVYVATDVTPTL
jgi:hypothetical protein